MMKLTGKDVIGGRMKRLMGLFIPFLNFGNFPSLQERQTLLPSNFLVKQHVSQQIGHLIPASSSKKSTSMNACIVLTSAVPLAMSFGLVCRPNGCISSERKHFFFD